MTRVLFDGRVIAPPPCLADYPEAEPVPPLAARVRQDLLACGWWQPGVSAAEVAPAGVRVLAWVVVLLVTSVVASVAVACLCGAAVAVKLAADFLTH